jgi:hypothetical protein
MCALFVPKGAFAVSIRFVEVPMGHPALGCGALLEDNPALGVPLPCSSHTGIVSRFTPDVQCRTRLVGFNEIREKWRLPKPPVSVLGVCRESRCTRGSSTITQDVPQFGEGVFVVIMLERFWLWRVEMTW